VDTCGTCHSELAPEWKFCVHCGTPVPVAEIPPLEPIPAAIRPELPVPPVRRRWDARLVFGTVMSGIGIVAILYAAVNLLAVRG
jgi:hypothetical protein